MHEVTGRIRDFTSNIPTLNANRASRVTPISTGS